MTREELRAASETLERAAADLGGDYADRARRQAESLASLAERERGPDHGRLARIDRVLTELIDATDSDDVATARERVRSYRETVEGV
jgi:hypothetical protein